MKIGNSNNTAKENDVVQVQTWEDLFNLTIDITKNEIHCATLALFKGIVEKFDSSKHYGIARFAPIPMTTKQESYEILAYFFDKASGDPYDEKTNPEGFNENQVYCIIFTDYNFKNSIETLKQKRTSDPEVHSLSFGVVVKLK